MERRLVEFHQYHWTGKRRKGVVYTIVNPHLRMVFFGWSMCNTGRGDRFTPQTGIDIARKRALKVADKQDSDFVLNYTTDGEVKGVEWRLYGPMATLPESMVDTLSYATRRAFRIIESIEARRAKAECAYETFVTEMSQKYPDLYKTCSIEVSDGWLPIVEKGFRITQKYRDMGLELEVNQVKQKFGGLRFYTSVMNYEGESKQALMDNFNQEIRDLEDEASKTCETCGVTESVLLRTNGGWVRTLCVKCKNKSGYFDLPADPTDQTA